MQSITGCLGKPFFILHVFFFSIWLFMAGPAHAQQQASISYSLEPNTWAQLVVPGNPSGYSISELFSDDFPGEPYGESWVIFTYDPQTPAYTQLESTSNLAQGQAFWITQVTDAAVELDLPENLPEAGGLRSPVCQAHSCATVALDTHPDRDSWSMVGSPFMADTNTAALRLQYYGGLCVLGCTFADVGIPVLWHYDGDSESYENKLVTGTLSPWDGLWSYAASSSTTPSPLLYFPAPDRGTTSDPGFIEMAEAIRFTRIRVFDGYINETQTDEQSELDSIVDSGGLVTIEVEFESTLSDPVDHYAVSAQLLPITIADQLNDGDTLGEMLSNAAASFNGEGVAELGGTMVEVAQTGASRAIIHAKLPIVGADTDYKVAVSPPLNFLATSDDIHDEDIDIIPALVDDQTITINEYSGPVAMFSSAPVLDDENGFTIVEESAEFNDQGYTIEPVLQTSLSVDLTSFAETESVGVRVVVDLPNGESHPLALAGFDEADNVVFDEEAYFELKNTGSVSQTIPVIAHADRHVQRRMERLATPISDIADEIPENVVFRIEMFPVVDGNLVVDESVASGGEAEAQNNVGLLAMDTASVTQPLVSVRNRVVVQDPLDLTTPSILRFGIDSCLWVLGDIDSGEIANGTRILTTTCPASPANNFSVLWRYDPTTKWIITSMTDRDGNLYCITGIGFFSAEGFELYQCGLSGINNVAQEFVRDGNKLKYTDFDIYIDVQTDPSNPNWQIVGVAFQPESATDFFNTPSTLSLSSSGQIFNVEKYINNSWGNAESAQVSLEFGGESSVDYLPIIGTTTLGKAKLSASVLNQSADLFDMSFAFKQHFDKKLSITGATYPDAVVENGATFDVSVAGFEALSLGNMIESTVTDYYNPLTGLGNTLYDVTDVNSNILTYTMDESFVSTTIVVVVVPVSVGGGVRGDVNLNVSLRSPGIGFTTAVTQSVSLEGYVSASIEALVVRAGFEGRLDLMEQSLRFSANGGFNTLQQDATKLTSSIGSSLESELKLLRGEIIGFADYITTCWCVPPVKRKRVQTTIYRSDYLAKSNSTVYSAFVNPTIIDF